MPAKVKRRRRPPVGSQWRLLAYGRRGRGVVMVNFRSADYPHTPNELGAKMEARKAELMAMPSTKSLPSKLLGAVASAISPGTFST